MKAFFSLTLLLFSAIGTAFAAQTVYVDDKLFLTLRSTQGDGYQVLQTMPSGTQLELLETDGDHARVRTREGEEGWVKSQYLSDEPTAALRLADAERKLERIQADAKRRIERLQADNRNLEQQLQSANSAKDQLAEKLATLSAENRELQKDMAQLRAAAAAPLELQEENTALKTRVGVLEKEAGALEEENAVLHNRTRRDWFLTGAGVLGGGIVLGLVLPRLRRRRSTFGDF